MTQNDQTDAALDALFAELRAEPAPELSETLRARILHDAARVQPSGPTAPVPVPAPSKWTLWREMLGGWGALGGIAAAGVAGLWIGVAPPQAVSDLTARMIGENLSVTVYSTDTGAFPGAGS